MTLTGKTIPLIALPLLIVVLAVIFIWVTRGGDDRGLNITKSGNRKQSVIDCKPKDDHQWYRTNNTFLINPQNPDIMYVNVEWKGFYKSTDGGKTWSRKVNGIFTDYIDSATNENCYAEYPSAIIDPDNPNRILLATAGSPGTLKDINSQGGGIYETIDGGESWKQKIRDDMNVYTTYLALVFQPGDSQTYYYGTSAAPASYSEADPNKIFVTKGIIYKTTDNGVTWQELETGFIKHARLTSIIIDPKNPDTITASTLTVVRNPNGPSQIGEAQMGIIQSLDGGKSWKRVDNLPKGYEGGYEMKAAFHNANHMYFVSSVNTDKLEPKSFYSFDAGRTWQESDNYMDSISYDPYDNTGNRMLGYSWWQCKGPCPKTLWQSLDGGKTWQSFGTLPSEIINLQDHKTRIQNIVWHPTDKNTIFMTGAGGLVWKSSNNGQTWVKLLDYTQI